MVNRQNTHHSSIQVIKESLRLYPSAPFTGRTLTRDIVLSGGRASHFCTVYLSFSFSFYSAEQRFAMVELIMTIAMLYRQFHFEIDPNYKLKTRRVGKCAEILYAAAWKYRVALHIDCCASLPTSRRAGTRAGRWPPCDGPPSYSEDSGIILLWRLLFVESQRLFHCLLFFLVFVFLVTL